MNKWLLLICVIINSSCSNIHRNMGETTIAYDSISIPIDFPFISNYVQIHPYVNGDTLYMLGYNHLTHSIDLIDISNRQKHKSIKLEREGDNGVYNVNSINGSHGKFAVMELSGMKWLSSDGKVLRNVPLLEFVDSLKSYKYSLMNKGLSPGNYVPFAYSVENQYCYLPMTPLNNNEFEYFSVGMMVDLTDGDCKMLECTYPSPYDKVDSNWGTYFKAQFSIMDADRIIFNFFGNSHYWIYNMKTSELIVKNMPSVFTENEAAFPNSQDNFLDEFMSLRFRPVHFIPSLQSFVRIHHAAKKELKDMSNKRYLMYMEEKGIKPIEYLMPSSFSDQYFVHDTSLYFLLKNTNDSEVKLGVINLEKISK